ncbi:MAG TPA: response regulator [Planctomycetota bacterium]|nr:response regulator [Planctomycetota bacterium]
MEDEKHVRTAIAATLRKAGFKTRLAPSGASGLKVNAKSPSSVALLDMRLRSGPDGLQTARMLKARHPAISILGLTAFEAEYRPSDTDQVVDKWISKPIVTRESKEALVASIREAATRSAMKHRGTEVRPSHPDQDAAALLSSLVRELESVAATLRMQAPQSGLPYDRFLLVLISASLLISSSNVKWKAFVNSLLAEMDVDNHLREALARIDLQTLAVGYASDMTLLFKGCRSDAEPDV